MFNLLSLKNLQKRSTNQSIVYSRRLAFSKAVAQKQEKTKQTIFVSTKKHKPIICVSEYGDLLNVKPLTNLKNADGKEDLRQVFMVDDNTEHKKLLKKLDHNPKAFFLFHPQGHYANAMSIYSALKRTLDTKYYGTAKKKTKKAQEMADDPEKVSFKGTPFHSCEIPYEVFHMNRRTKLTIK